MLVCNARGAQQAVCVLHVLRAKWCRRGQGKVREGQVGAEGGRRSIAWALRRRGVGGVLQQAAQPTKRCFARAAWQQPVSWQHAGASTEREVGGMRQKVGKAGKSQRGGGHNTGRGRVCRCGAHQQRGKIRSEALCVQSRAGRRRWVLGDERRTPGQWRRAIWCGAERRWQAMRGAHALRLRLAFLPRRCRRTSA